MIANSNTQVDQYKTATADQATVAIGCVLAEAAFQSISNNADVVSLHFKEDGSVNGTPADQALETAARLEYGSVSALHRQIYCLHLAEEIVASNGSPDANLKLAVGGLTLDEFSYPQHNLFDISTRRELDKIGVRTIADAVSRFADIQARSVKINAPEIDIAGLEKFLVALGFNENLPPRPLIEAVSAEREDGERFWLRQDRGEWEQVTEAEYIAAERRAGFSPKHGCGPVATSSFHHAEIRGQVTYGDEVPDSIKLEPL